MNDFGDFLYSLRREKGMTQAQLAAMLGVTNKAVSKWETGEAMPETSQLVPIARIFGVTVDELLEGRRKDKKEIFDNERHIFLCGKQDGEKTLAEKICGAVCAALIFAGFVSYLLIGLLTGLWSPYWVIMPVCALLCGITGIVFDMCNPVKRAKKTAKGENPYIGGVCGLLILSCVAVYLSVSVFTGLWHPLWIIVAVGAVACAFMGAIGEIINHIKRK